MKSETKEKIRLTTKEILLTFCDGINIAEEIIGYKWQRKQAREYWKWRELDKNRFHDSLRRLEKQGYINKYIENKKEIIKTTKIGNEKALKYIFNETKIKTPEKWDKKWRVVIFDIPEEKKYLRNVVRERLKRWGFYKLQMSVFVYPFDCQKEIASLKYLYNLGPYLQYLVAESIETEKNLIGMFFDQNILNKKLLIN